MVAILWPVVFLLPLTFHSLALEIGWFCWRVLASTAGWDVSVSEISLSFHWAGSVRRWFWSSVSWHGPSLFSPVLPVLQGSIPQGLVEDSGLFWMSRSMEEGRGSLRVECLSRCHLQKCIIFFRPINLRHRWSFPGIRYFWAIQALGRSWIHKYIALQ